MRVHWTTGIVDENHVLRPVDDGVVPLAVYDSVGIMVWPSVTCDVEDHILNVPRDGRTDAECRDLIDPAEMYAYAQDLLFEAAARKSLGQMLGDCGAGVVATNIQEDPAC